MARQSLLRFQQRKSRSGCWPCLLVCADLAAYRQQWVRTARLMGACETMRTALGVVLNKTEQAERRRLRASLTAALGEARLAEEERAGRVLPEEDVIALALDEGSLAD